MKVTLGETACMQWPFAGPMEGYCAWHEPNNPAEKVALLVRIGISQAYWPASRRKGLAGRAFIRHGAIRSP